jgi:hypothetical protein
MFEDQGSSEIRTIVSIASDRSESKGGGGNQSKV